MIEAHSEDPGRRQAKRKALFFTLIVHLGLVLALFLGVQWKSSQPEVMEVELWSPRPTPATAPPPPKLEPRPEPKEEAPKPKPEPRLEPKPEPKKPEIVVKEEKKKPEPKKPEPPKPEPPKPEPKKPEPKKSDPVKPEPAKPVSDPFKEMLERETRQRQSNEVSRLAAQAEAEQRAAAGRKGLENYVGKIRGKVRGNIVLPPAIQGNPEAELEVTQLPSGEVLSVRVKRSSGVAALDSAIERAFWKSSPLPRPDDASQFSRVLNIKYKPFEE